MIELTGLRNPCAQLNDVDPRLLGEVAKPQDDGSILRRAGVMSIVVEGGVVRPGDAIRVVVPVGAAAALEPI